MTYRRVLIGIMLAVVLLGIVPALGMAQPCPSHSAQAGTELLTNPGFEGISCRAGSKPPECLDNWSNSANHDGSTHGNIFTPQGWVTWWREGGDYGQPEVKTIPNVAPFTGELPRIRSGYYAVLLFTYYRLQETGLYQVVTGLVPGATVQFSAYGHGWSCNSDDRPGYSCGDPWNQVFQVGIEPNGLADPFSASIVWSTEQTSPDTYHLIGPITAQVGPGGSVVVYLRSKTKWMYEHQDAYWDDASLVYVGEPAAPTSAPPPVAQQAAQAGPPPTPRPTPTPRPDGAIVHIVEPGDTVFGLALTYGVDVDQLRRLNAGSIGAGDLIVVGQELMISPPLVQPTAVPPAEPTAEADLVAAVAAAPAGASICVLAYHDRNGDTFRNDAAAEELLPGVELTVADATGVLARYTSDGINEPHCFSFPSGTYRVIQTAPAGYVASGQAEQTVTVADGASLLLQFGSVGDGEGRASDETAGTAPTTGEESSGTAEGSTATRVLTTVAKISGLLVLLLAVGMAVLFVLSRRKV
jgi:LysM repeat protein